MLKGLSYSLPFLVFYVLNSLPSMADGLIEPVWLEVNTEWLTSEPQAGVDYHIFKACSDMDMTEDCTKGIYKAKANGAMSIPSNNRCIYRVGVVNGYTLYYQIKAASTDGRRSPWTIPRSVNVYREFVNRDNLSYSYLLVQYETDS